MELMGIQYEMSLKPGPPHTWIMAVYSLPEQRVRIYFK
jgi:hypothetical protein